MKSFLQRFAPFVLGVLMGYDRLRFRGSKRLLCHPHGAMGPRAMGPRDSVRKCL
jgi:hypothetical protein